MDWLSQFKETKTKLMNNCKGKPERIESDYGNMILI